MHIQGNRYLSILELNLKHFFMKHQNLLIDDKIFKLKNTLRSLRHKLYSNRNTSSTYVYCILSSKKVSNQGIKDKG